MEQEELKAKIRHTFDTVCKGYDGEPLRFFRHAAARLPQVFAFRGDEQLLDVAAGTGTPALACAAALPRGAVTAVDFSGGMLAEAEVKAHAAGVENIAFKQMDMTAMPLAEGRFDAANCSFGIFFVEDMAGTLRHIASKVRAGGIVVTTHFLEGSFEPLSKLFRERVQRYGIEPPPLGWMRLGSEEQNHTLFEEAGLSQISHHHYDVGYRFHQAEEWWEVIWNAGYRSLIAGLDEKRLAQFKAEHLAEIAALDEGAGIPFHIEVIITRGVR